MKEQKSIPTSKIERAAKFVTTGIKIGGNYLKHYTKKAFNPEITREELHEDNARDIYNALSKLKGSALKVAQMMSMDKNLLPRAYAQRFTMAQYSAPPLSGPLVVKTFQKYFGKTPQELYDSFEMKASNAASIGQVHIAYKYGKKLAVKIQYPGIAESISSDLKMVKPFAVTILQLPDKDIDKYLEEVESKLYEETDYDLELKRSIEISERCKHIPNLRFATYYPELSCKKILTMEWLDGLHMKEFLLTNPSQAIRNQIGQALWNFYDFQFHTLKAVHADPHPGNFLMREDGTLGIIDFGCVKEIPQEFYHNYFLLVHPQLAQNEALLEKVFWELEFYQPQDSEKERAFFRKIFLQMIELLCRPFRYEYFDFSDDAYFKEIYDFGESLAQIPEIRDSKQARGSKHSLYINRTYFGLYSMLNELRAFIKIEKPDFLKQPLQ
ncbi:MAG: AarF/ABC1/UbiB kinase family protein [Microscillaceae bacterium]|nr:AarF/ABC1/UbiB kinase family protein [Microscillaceae bacterium]MDW8461109.1 AarF/ABC1/UbiB kinase family protein [Cytophagales bacterium]